MTESNELPTLTQREFTFLTMVNSLIYDIEQRARHHEYEAEKARSQLEWAMNERERFLTGYRV